MTDAQRLPSPPMVQIEREELISLLRIRRMAGSLLTSAGDKERIMRELDEACSEHYHRFEMNPQQRWKTGA